MILSHSLSPALYCYEYDSDKNTPTTYCSSRIGCYRMERRDPNTKVVTRQKQGCSESCVEEERNRVTKICCNSTLCNGFQWQTPPPFLTTSPPETSGEGSGYMASEILQSISTSSKQPVASTSSRYPTSTAYQATTSTVEPLSLRTGSSTLLISKWDAVCGIVEAYVAQPPPPSGRGNCGYRYRFLERRDQKYTLPGYRLLLAFKLLCFKR